MTNVKFFYVLIVFLMAVTLNAQISTGSGGGESIFANTITSNNNVGIGTPNPTATLEVNGAFKSKQGVFTNGLPNGSVFDSPSDRNDKCLILTAGSILGSGSGYLNTRMFHFYDFPESNINNKSNFYFGIEDRNDNNRFRVSAETDGNTQMLISNKNQEEFMKIFDDGNNNVYMQFGKANSRLIIGGFSNYPNGLDHKLFVQNGSAKIEGNILTDSNIGIGTSNFIDGDTTYRLSVKGKIRAEEIKVYNTWADYVFSSTYELPSLKEVENYITKNGHLKNVPSAKSILENGLELGEITKIQQEKIEELTLYLIQQSKEIEELKEQMKLLLLIKK
jgi:hypothetical protein